MVEKAFSIAQSHQCVARGTNSTYPSKVNFGKNVGNDRSDVSDSRAWLRLLSCSDFSLSSLADQYHYTALIQSNWHFGYGASLQYCDFCADWTTSAENLMAARFAN